MKNISWKRVFLYGFAAMTVYSYFRRDFAYIFEFIDIPITVLGFVGAISYVNHLEILWPWFWKAFAPLSLAWDIYIRYLAWLLFQGSLQEFSIQMIPDLLIMGPFYYFLFSYAYRKPRLPLNET